jgi:hypothetical protein
LLVFGDSYPTTSTNLGQPDDVFRSLRKVIVVTLNARARGARERIGNAWTGEVRIEEKR